MAKKNHADKPFQKRKKLKKLLKSRKLIICKSDKCFSQHSYYYLINGYSKIFIHTKIAGVPDYSGAKIDDLLALENFDFEIRTRVLKEILKLENKIKNHVFYVFAANYGDEDYLIPSHFDTFGGFQKIGQIHAMLAILNNKISKNTNSNMARNHPAFYHYIRNHKNVPPWVLKLELTLGELSKFYSNLKPPIRQIIANEYGVSEGDLRTIIYFLSQVRNRCAHNERLYDATIITRLKNNPYHTYFGASNTQDFFSILVALKFLMPRKEYVSLIECVEEELLILNKKIGTHYYAQAEQEMGLPTNWSHLKVL